MIASGPDARRRAAPGPRLPGAAAIVLAVVLPGATCNWLSDEGAPEIYELGLSVEAFGLDAYEGDTTAVSGGSVLYLLQGGQVTWSASTDQAWLAVSPAGGALAYWESVALAIEADPCGLGSGVYTGTVTVSDAAGRAPDVAVAVTFTVRYRAPLYFSPDVIDLSADEGGTAPAAGSASLAYSDTRALDWSASTDAAWLSASPASGLFSSPGSVALDVYADPTGLSAGFHIGHVTATDLDGIAPDASLAVQFHVRPPDAEAAFALDPGAATLYALEGDTAAATATVELALEGGAGVAWQATVADPWLAAAPESGTLSDGEHVEVTLSADPTGRATGNYVTTVTFSAPGGEAADLTLRAALAVRPSTNGASYMAKYVSVIDDSEQPYGVYLPSLRTAPSPVVVTLHGYGGGASSFFSSTVTTRANARGWILVSLHGRGQHFYDGPAETDLFEVLADVDGAWGVDWSRVYVEGLSMGATGAFRLVARHPDVFAGSAGSDGWSDFHQWHDHWYAPLDDPTEWHPSRTSNLENACCLSYAENIPAETLYIGVDGADTVVLPENGRKLHQKLDRLGTPHQYVYNASGGHCGTYNQAAMHDWLYASTQPLDPDPVAVSIRANRLRTAKHAWMQVERFVWNGFAELEAVRAVAGDVCTFDVTVRNVHRFTIRSAPAVGAGGRYVVDVNGTTCADEPHDATFPLTVDLDVDATGAVVAGAVLQPSGTEPPAKTPAVDGPVARAISERFVVAYGSASLDPAVTARNKLDAEEFCKSWADIWPGDGIWPPSGSPVPGYYGYNAVIAPVDEATLTRADFAACNVLLFGSEESSVRIDQMCTDASLPFNLPVRLTEEAIALGGSVFDGARFGIWMVYPNPLAPDRLVVIGHNAVGETSGLTGAIFWIREAYAWQWPDYMVFDTSAPLRDKMNGGLYPADQYVLAGEFDQGWTLPAAGSPATAVGVATDRASYPAATPVATVTVIVEDELGAFVQGLAASAFDARIDGEARGSAFVEVAPGVYESYVSIVNLFAAKYDVTVEVVRPFAGAPVVGLGRARFEVY